jgi:hypothetical protein
MAVAAGKAAAWSAAAPHMDLPAELLDLAANVARVDAERAGIVAALGPVSAAEQIASGVAANDALAIDSEARQAAEHAAEARRAVATALAIARKRLDVWVCAHRDDLITAAAGPVERLLADVATALGALDPFAPTFDPVAIADAATSDQLAAWQASRPANEALGAIRTAWLSTWRSATSSAGQHPGARRAHGSLRPGRPGGVHTWEDPWSVADVDVRDGVAVDVLRIAHWHHAATYRLATLAELTGLARRVPLARPQVGRERARRPILLPPHEQTTPPTRSRAMGV